MSMTAISNEATTPSRVSASEWYVLNYIPGTHHTTAQSIVERFNDTARKTLELFAPTYVVKEEKAGETRFRTVNLAFHYVFLRGTLDDVKQLCGQSNGFSFLIDRGNPKRYATIGDRAMANFKNIARAYKNCLPYYSLEDIELEDGDLVEVIKGDFPGLIGTYMPKPKSKSGNIILNIYNKVGTIAFDVHASDVRVLEFSKRSTRANDQIDAFLPHLLKALRYHVEGEAIPSALVAKLTVFCGRMGIVKLNNRKLDARLQAMLYAANTLTGHRDATREAKARYDSLSASVTNPWTRAANTLLLTLATSSSDIRTHRPHSSELHTPTLVSGFASSISDRTVSDSSPAHTALGTESFTDAYGSDPLSAAYASIAELKPTSKLQHLLKEEYHHYLGEL